jgi:hypothetical protein
MQYSTLLLISFFVSLVSSSFAKAANEQDTTATWQSCIAFYKELDEQSDWASLQVFGKSDAGRELHCLVINKELEFDPERFNRKKSIVLINNAIHPGEPDGVEASMRLCAQLLDKESELSNLLSDVIVCVVPMYNVDGASVRGRFSRANQLGPAEYGFRGNALNLDLNRDFVKCDSRNALAFNSLLTRIRPHVMVDTHVSNGADYAHTLTLITTQSDKLGYAQGSYVRNELEPLLYQAMDKTDYPMVPYVHTMGRTPESGIEGFLETARFATGYAALHGVIGLTTETHMLKPFAQRVEATHVFLVKLLEYGQAHRVDLLKQYQEGEMERLSADGFALKYLLDTTSKEMIPFKGYEAMTEPALVGSGSRLRYERGRPWSKKIAYYKRYTSAQFVKVPAYYVIPQAWSKVIERLDSNHVQYSRFNQDTVIEVKVSYAEQFETSKSPYEGHYFHHHILCRDTVMKVPFMKGDYCISTHQDARRYLVEALEPNSDEGFFAWNFFDSMLQQKEWFSDYVFEDIAADLLAKDPTLKAGLEWAMKGDKNLAEDHWQQLYWIYKRSPYYETSAYRVPVFRWNP